jgi:hypothetical protein
MLDKLSSKIPLGCSSLVTLKLQKQENIFIHSHPSKGGITLAAQDASVNRSIVLPTWYYC